MSRYLNETSGIAFRFLFLAALIGGLWLACRMVWGGESKAACPAMESPRSKIMDRLAQQHVDSMARVQYQSHQGFGRRASEIRDALGVREVAEICAESWERQRDDTPEQLWVEFVKCWKQSPGHWKTASVKHKWIGAAMARGKNGIWYGCIVAAD